MLRRTLIGTFFMTAFLLTTSSVSPRPTGATRELSPHVDGEILIKFKSGVTRLTRDRVLVQIGTREAARVGRSETRRVRLTRLSVLEAIERYSQHPDVEYVEPNYLISIAAIPNDQNFAAQWNLSNSGQSGGTPGADVSAISAWDVSTDAPNVLTAVIDTGIDLTHPDLVANLNVNPGEIANNGVDDDNNGFIDDVYGWDFLDGDNNPTDDNGHGTHVAGTIGAIGNNGIGVAGIVWNTKLMACRFLNAGGQGNVAGATGCIDYAVMMGVDIINASWTGVGGTTLREAVERSFEAGVLFVAAAGNTSGGNNNDAFPVFPASYEFPNIISVAATNHDDQLWPDSHFGRNTVDIAAPGVNILSTWPTGYVFLNGTSMAAPHVAGVAALIKEQVPDIDASALRQLILDRADRLPNLQGIVGSGGRLNAFLAIADQDQTPPGQIDDLATSSPDATRMDLAWTATGDDNMAGKASRYEVRYDTMPIDADGFASAPLALDPPAPATSGESETMRVDGLVPDTTYYFVVRAFDEFNNASPLSNNAMGTTSGPPRISVEPSSLDQELITGQRVTRMLTLHNDGAGEYTFRVNPERPAAAQALRPVLQLPEFGAGVALEEHWPGPWGPGETVPTTVPATSQLSATGEDPTGGFSVLIVESGADVEEIRTALLAFLDFAVVDVHSGRFEPPSLELLQAYDAVIVVANLPFEDSGNIGDALADYVDGGGGLVLTLASFISGWQFDGRFTAEGYYPFNIGSGPVGGSTLGAFDSTHPIMTGVEAATGDLLGNVTVASGANLVASWANGQPFVATRRGTVAGVNVYVAGAGFWQGDIPLILHNAALWASNVVSWLAVAPETGVVPAGESLDVEVVFNATSLIGGGYDGSIVFRGDDPDNPVLTVAARLDVIGAADLTTEPGALDFGELFVGRTVDRNLSVLNIGSEDLTITAIGSDNPDFSTDAGSFSLSPGGRKEITVTFAPTTDGAVDTTLTVVSDDPDQPEFAVPMHGAGLIPPDVKVSPANLFDSLISGESSTQILFITNDGGSDLVFRLDREELLATAGSSYQVTDPQRPTDGMLPFTAPTPLPVTGALQPGGIGLDPTRPTRPTLLTGPMGSDAGSTLLPIDAAGAPFEFDEDFEDGNIDGWTETISSNFKAVTDDTAADGSLFSYRQRNQQAGHFNGIFHATPGIQPEYIGFWVRSSSVETNDAYFVMTGGENNFESLFFFANEEGQFYINADVGGNTSFDYEANTWYFVEFRNIDFVDREFDYYVDSELIQDAIPFRNPADVVSFQRVNLYNFDSDAVAWWDEIVISDDPPAQAIRLDPKRGVVPAGETLEIEVRFDSRGLLAGDHFTNIFVESNDPDDPVVVVSTLLNVIGAPDIEFPDGVPDFGDVFINTTSTIDLRIANLGTDTLEVSSISFEDPAFSVEPDTLTLKPEEFLTIELSFTATEIGPTSATMTMVSNDLDQNPLTLEFTAVGVEPPAIGVDPEQLDDQLFTGQNNTHVVTVTNSGGSNLVFTVATEILGSSAAMSSNDVRGPAPAEYQPPRADTHLPADAPLPVAGLGASGGSNAVTFYDGFEDGDFDGWGDQGGDGLKAVTDLTAANGTRYSYTESNAPGGHLTGIFQPLNGIQPRYASFWVRSPDRSTADSYYVLRDADGRVAIFFFANDLGLLYINADVGGNTAVSYEAGEWVFVEFKNIDFTRQFFDYWINGELVQDRVPFRNAGSIDSFEQLDLYSFDQGASGFWDEILISDNEPVETIAVSPLGATVAPGESIDLAVRLDARRADSGVNDFVVRIDSNDPTSPTTAIPVTLEVVGAPDIDLPRTDLSFGTRFTGTSTTLSLDVVNEGPIELLVNVTIDNPVFTVTPANLLLGPGGESQLVVTFSPTSTGAHTASLVLDSNDPDEGEVIVALSGNAEEPPDIDISPTSISEQLHSTQMSTRTMRIGNAGANALNWSIFFDGLQPGWLHVAPRGGTMPPGTAVDVTLDFNAGPLQPGLYETTLRVESDDPDEPLVLVPVVMQVSAAPVIAVSPDPLEFEDAFVGTTSVATLQISNLGDAPLEVSNIVIDDPQFALATTSLTVAPDTASGLEISFTPQALGPVVATLTLTSNDPFTETVSVRLEGTGEAAPDVVVSPASFAETMSSFEVLLRQLSIENIAGAALDFEIEVTGRGPVGADPLTDAGFIESPPSEDDRPPEWLAPMATLGLVIPGTTVGLEARPVPAHDIAKGGGGNTVIFRDDFEDGAFTDTWLLDPSESARTISSTTAADFSNKSYREAASDPGHLTGIHQNLPGLRPGYIGFWVHSSSLETNDGYVILRDSNMNEAIFFFLSEVGRIYCNADVGGDFSVRYFENTWMFIEFKNIDFEAQTFDYFVNYQQFSRAVPFRNFGAIQDFSRIDLYNFSGGADAHWDELVFATENPFDALRVRPYKGTVEAGLGISVNAIFDTRNLVEGRYEAEIRVRSNDPDQPEIVIPAILDHIGVVNVSVNPGEIDFGQTLVGVPKLDRVTVVNRGTARLIASAVVLDHPNFSTSVDEFELGPGKSRSIEVRYDPPGPETVETVMSLHTNDPDTPVLDISIKAFSVIPARLEFDPESLEESLYTGQTSTRTIEITNPGGLTLEYDLDLRTPLGIPIPAESLILDDDLETGFGGWTTQVYSQEDLWHLSERDANSPSTAWWCGDEATGHYATPYAISTATITPPIDLREMEAPIRISFWENHITEPGFDQCMVDLSLDGGDSWIPLRGAYGAAPSGDSRGWQKRFLNLDAYGGNIIHIRFYFETMDPTNNAFPGWFVDDVRVTALGNQFVTATPLSGTVVSGARQEIVLTFDAFEFRPAGVYEALVQVSSNDPFAPFTPIAATLTVADPGRLAIPGEPVVFESTSDAVAGNVHSFPIVFPPAGPGSLTVIAAGDYDAPDEKLMVTAESYFAGEIGGTGATCSTVEGEFTIPAGTLRHIASDAEVEVTLRDTAAVNSTECPTVGQTVRLSYPRALQQVDFGEVQVGASVERMLEVANVGDGILHVTSITTANADLVVGTTELTLAPQSSAAVALTWTPTGSGLLGGSISVNSDDPFSSQATIGLSGIAAGASPRAEIFPKTLEVALPPHSDRTKTRTVRIVNSGAGDLIWDARFAQTATMATIAPAAGTVAPGGFAEITVTLYAEDLDEGDYSDALTITTNDPDNPRIDVAVTLHVKDVELDMLKIDFTPKFADRPGTVEVYIQLPTGYVALDIDLSTVDLNGVSPDPTPVVRRDSDRDQVTELILQFDAEQLDQTIPPGETIELRVSGEVRDKAWFHGSKYVRGRVIVDPPE